LAQADFIVAHLYPSALKWAGIRATNFQPDNWLDIAHRAPSCEELPLGFECFGLRVQNILQQAVLAASVVAQPSPISGL
jgi:hypothetical protein